MNQSQLEANKHATGTKRGKTRVNHVAIGFGLAPYWLKNSTFALIGQSELHKLLNQL